MHISISEAKRGVDPKKYKIHVCLHSENCKLTIDWWYNIVLANG